MASEDLLKKAVAAFNALSPEQQAEMLEEQRQSWVRGNVGLSRDERGMTSPVMPRPAPAATDTGLVRLSLVRGGGLEPNQNGDYIRFSQAVELLAAVTIERDFWKDRFQRDTEAIRKLEAELAAERAETERWHKKAMDAGVITHSDGTTSHPMRKELDGLKADNAALTARVKELRELLTKIADKGTLQALKDANDRSEALEAKLAAAEKSGVRHD